MPKVALAYSGSLDTTLCVWYLKNMLGHKVITFSANLGQPEYLEPLAEQAVELGAFAAHIADLRDTFARRFIWPCVRSEAIYQKGYHLFSALGRPLIVEELVAIARSEGCELVAHGSRATGNDLIRFENCVKALAPDLKILTPLQTLGLRSPQEEIAFAQKHNIPTNSSKQTLLNMEQNLWGCDIQIHHLDSWDEPSQETYVLTTPLSEAPNRASVIELDFEQGIPTAIDKEPTPPVKLIEKLNKIAGRCGVGRYDVFEDRILQRKSREVYEAPAAAVLYAARDALASITLDKDARESAAPLAQRFAHLVYEGRWFSTLRMALERFFETLNEKVTGKVRLSLYKGNVQVAGVSSPHSLYKPGAAPTAPTLAEQIQARR